MPISPTVNDFNVFNNFETMVTVTQYSTVTWHLGGKCRLNSALDDLPPRTPTLPFNSVKAAPQQSGTPWSPEYCEYVQNILS